MSTLFDVEQFDTENESWKSTDYFCDGTPDEGEAARFYDRCINTPDGVQYRLVRVETTVISPV